MFNKHLKFNKIYTGICPLQNTQENLLKIFVLTDFRIFSVLICFFNIILVYIKLFILYEKEKSL